MEIIMKKIKKLPILVFCTLLIGILFVLFCLNNLDMVFESAPSDHFTQICTQVFQNPEDFYVLDETGNDITDDFIEEHQVDFDRGDFDSIWKDFTNNNYTFRGQDLLKKSSVD